MRRDRRRSDHFPDAGKMVQPPSGTDPDDAPPTVWERGFIWLEFFGFGVLFVSGMAAGAWSAIRYFAGWS